MKWFTYEKDRTAKDWIISSGSITLWLVFFRWVIAKELWWYDVQRAEDEPSRIYHWFQIARERSLVQDDLPLSLMTIGPLRFYLGWLG